MNFTMITTILSFFGGLGLFIYGMETMAEGLSLAAGTRTKMLLEKLTSNRLMAVGAGALITALIQSSSATTVLVVGFVNASLMSLSQACGVIMGANIGTTMTAWIVSMGEWAKFLKPEVLAPLFLVVGVAMALFTRSGRVKDSAKILVGFGMLFTGLSTMSGAIAPYTDSPVFTQAFSVIGSNPLLGILVGAGVTAIIQSSSASMGILQTLAAAGAVNWGSAVYIALGQNIGTCVTALLSSISGDTNAKRAAMIHLEFNVIGAILAACAAGIYFMVMPTMASASVGATGLALFHTGFNIAVTVVLFPFANQLVALSKLLIPDHKKEGEASLEGSLDPRFLALPEAALSAVDMEMDRIGESCMELIEKTRNILVDGQDPDTALQLSSRIQHACRAVRKYLGRIDPNGLTLDMQQQIQKKLLEARDMLQISVSARGLASLHGQEEGQNPLDESSIEIINSLSSLCIRALSRTLEPADVLRRDNVRALALRIQEIEQSVSSQHALLQARDDHKLDEAWLMMETCDLYLQIARRIVRIEDESSWKNPGLLALGH